MYGKSLEEKTFKLSDIKRTFMKVMFFFMLSKKISFIESLLNSHTEKDSVAEPKHTMQFSK
jgi:hypothetical protein